MTTVLKSCFSIILGLITILLISCDKNQWVSEDGIVHLYVTDETRNDGEVQEIHFRIPSDYLLNLHRNNKKGGKQHHIWMRMHLDHDYENMGTSQNEIDFNDYKNIVSILISGQTLNAGSTNQTFVDFHREKFIRQSVVNIEKNNSGSRVVAYAFLKVDKLMYDLENYKNLNCYFLNRMNAEQKIKYSATFNEKTTLVDEISHENKHCYYSNGEHFLTDTDKGRNSVYIDCPHYNIENKTPNKCSAFITFNNRIVHINFYLSELYRWKKMLKKVYSFLDRYRLTIN